MLQTFILPVCEVCGEPWLPRKGPMRDDPTTVPRCGKCKSPKWNASGAKMPPKVTVHVDEGIAPETQQALQKLADTAVIQLAAEGASVNRYTVQEQMHNTISRCRHSLMNCSECTPKGDQNG